MAWRKRVVVLEDDPGVQRVLRDLVETEGWTTCWGESIDDVAGSLRWASVLLLDLHLPGIGGLEVLRDVRELGLDLVVIVLSGDDEGRAEARAAGADHVLGKPFEVAQLLAVLRGIAADAMARDEVDVVLDVRESQTAVADDLPWFASR